ncbi:MAG TPA: RodZ domain-containing protein [Usitatibacter sp.]|nr:RodZ domain-containing protein [Usitatibacter sp.]
MQAEAESVVTEEPRKTLGQMFAAERERQGLSRSDAAQRLHMSAYQVEALETGDYGRLPKGTFLRGFVRNYAKVLGLSADAVLPLLAEDGPRDGRPGIVVPTQNIRFDPLGDRLQNPYVKAAVLAVVAVAIAFAAMYWWLFIRTAPPAHHTTEAVPVAAVPAAPAAAHVTIATASPPAAPADPAKAEAAKPEPARAEAPKTEAPKADSAKAAKADAPKSEAKPAPAPAPKVDPPGVAAAPVPAGSSVLKFRFHGESWVEIRDARGKVLLSKLNAAGSETEVAGKPPFSVIVGNAPEVKVFYNDREFDMEPHTKVAVARFTVE